MNILSQKSPEGIKARSKVIDTIITPEVTQTVINLYDRWQDESQLEDFKDYEKVMKDTFGNQFLKGTKKPFGCQLKIEGFPYTVQIYVNSKAVGWKSV